MISSLGVPKNTERIDVVKALRYSRSRFLVRTIVTQKYQAKIYVTLRPSVLDPAGTAVKSGLSHMGYSNIDQVRIGKYIELNIESDSESSAEQQLDRVCDQLLANPVIENYRIELTSVGGAA